MGMDRVFERLRQGIAPRVGQLARVAGISDRTIRNRMEDGTFESIAIGTRERRPTAESAIRLLESVGRWPISQD